MRIAYFSIAVMALVIALMAADAIATDFWTWRELNQTIAAQNEQLERLNADLLDYQRLTTDLKHAALAAK